MKRLQTFPLYLSLLLALTLGLQNCKKTEPDPIKPGSGTTTPGNGTTTTTTTAPGFSTAIVPTTSGITTSSVTVSAVLDGNGGAAISQHGFVYSKTVQLPTPTDSKLELGATTGPFPLTLTGKLTGLDANTMYYVRAFATNATGTSYGGVGQVKTSAVSGTAPIFKSIAWSTHSTTFPKGGIYDPSVLYLAGKIYTLGGGTPETSSNSTATQPDTDDFWEYDIAAKKWTQLPKMPFTSKDYVGSTINYVYKNKIYAGDRRAGIYEYDLSIRQWTKKITFNQSVDLPTCRMVLGDKLYAFTTGVGQKSKVVDLNTFQITDIPDFQTEAGSWFPTRATFMWNDRIHFWLKLRGQTDANTKLNTIAFDPKTNTYENLGTMSNLIPQVAASLEPTAAFEKNGFIYVYSRSFNNTFFLYNPTLKIMGGIAFTNKPANWTLKPMASDGQGNMYQVLGEAAAPIGFQLPLEDPKRYDTSVNHILFQ